MQPTMKKRFYRYTLFKGGVMCHSTDQKQNPKNFSNKGYALNHANADLALGYTVMIEPAPLIKGQEPKFY